jgi:hypothetical protein
MKNKILMLLLMLPMFASAQLTTTTGVVNSSSTSANMLLQTNGTTRVTISRTTGFMGVGTTAAPVQMLDVNGIANISGNLIYGSTAGSGLLHLNSSSNNFNVRLNATDRMTIANSTGYVGFGTTSRAFVGA